MKKTNDVARHYESIERRKILLIYVKSVGYVLFAYAAMTVGYLPAILSQVTDAIALMQETLEIGAYGTLVATAPSISCGLFMLYRSQQAQAYRDKKTMLLEELKCCFRSGIVALLSFVVYFCALMSVLPARSSNPIEQFGGAPHSSIYLHSSIIPCVLFHGLLLLFVGFFSAIVFMAAFGASGKICASFSFTVLVFQSIAYFESILGIPRKYCITSIYSGWFRVGTDTPILDLFWAAFVVLIHIAPFAMYVIRQTSITTNGKHGDAWPKETGGI